MTGDDMKDEGRVITLDKPRTFKLTWNSMRALQKQYETVEAAMEKVAAGDYDAILYVLWASQVGDDKLGLDELGELITPERFGEAFAEAFGLIGAAQKPKRRGLFHRKNADRPRR